MDFFRLLSGGRFAVGVAGGCFMEVCKYDWGTLTFTVGVQEGSDLAPALPADSFLRLLSMIHQVCSCMRGWSIKKAIIGIIPVSISFSI